LSREIKKILVIKLGALGDFVLALAAMKRIRAAHPKARITLLTTPPFEASPSSSGYFNTIETDGRAELVRRMAGTWCGACARRATTGSTTCRPRAAPRASSRPCARSRRSGRHRRWGALAPPAHQGPRPCTPWSARPTSCASPASGPTPRPPPGEAPPPDLSWILRKHPETRGPVAGAPPPKPYALFVPGGSAHRLEKRWPVEKFTELAGFLRGKGLDVVIIGGPQESAMARTIQKAGSGVRDLTGRTDFAQIAVLGARAALAVGNDTGPLHLIAAAGAPTIALFSRPPTRCCAVRAAMWR
jgi:ADP-heptose:LPS heptosyltransferase